MATKGYYPNPSHRSCYQTCRACFRCEWKVTGLGENCNGCSGKHDPFGWIDPDPDEVCTCTEGVLRFKDRHGKLNLVPYRWNPFGGQVTLQNKTEDEEQWDEYVKQTQEKLDDPTWEPVKIVDRNETRRRAGEFKYLGPDYGG